MLAVIALFPVCLSAQEVQGGSGKYQRTGSNDYFSGQVSVSYKGAEQTVRFSSRRLPSGEISIRAEMPSREKEVRATVSRRGYILQVAVIGLDNEVAVWEQADKDIVNLFSRRLFRHSNLRLAVQERFARVLAYLAEMAPVGVPLEIGFSEKDPAARGAYADPQMCWQMKGTTVALLGLTWTTYVDLRYYDAWLAARGWTYNPDRGICGISTTSICNRIGTVYKDRDGWISTNPWEESLVHPPQVFEPAHEPSGNTARVGFPANEQNCMGRCGPACFGAFHESFHNFSDVTYTAECFAHDACTGEAGLGKPDADIFVGEGYACVDEFINASWGYMHGPACTNTADLSDIYGWWRFTVNNRNAYFNITRQAVQEQTSASQKPKKMGTYLAVLNNEGNRVLQIKRRTKGILFTSTGGTYSGIVAQGGLKGMLQLTEGAFTTDNKTVKSFSAINLVYGGTVVDGTDSDAPPVEGVRVVVKAMKNGRAVWTSRAVTTGSDGAFVVKGLDPFYSYAAEFSKKGYNKLSKKNVGPLIAKGRVDRVPLRSTLIAVSAAAEPPAGGSVSGGGRFKRGASVTLTASPATGFTFVKWRIGAQEVSANPYNFKAAKSVKAVAEFAAQSAPTPTSTATPNPSCTFSWEGYNTTIYIPSGCSASADTVFTRWVTVSTQPGCAWSCTSDAAWLSFAPDKNHGVGSNQFALRSGPNYGSTEKTAHVTCAGTTKTYIQTASNC